MLNKFTSPEQLEKSYTDLEKEFTKKCQELAQLKKQLENAPVSQDISTSEKVDTTQSENIKSEKMPENQQNESNLKENILNCVMNLIDESVETHDETCPLEQKNDEDIMLGADDKKASIVEMVGVERIESEVEQTKDISSNLEEKSEFGLDLRYKASEFLRKNQEAKAFGKEMSKILLKDKKLLALDDPFMVAYAIALKNAKSNSKNQEESKPVEQPIQVGLEPKQKEKNENIVPLLGRDLLGIAPQKMSRKFGSIDEAGRELLKKLQV